ncbi:MAG: HisA/HisF-related TIM barrel protein [Candidatus Levybacteria bacterium]|nr:HisA/HisF-related TIM barrel protein [Candidatus Levybacteria bacterium]
MNEIIPGILEKEWSEIEKKLELVKPFAKTVHIDIIDGKFADNITFLDPAPFKKYENDFLLELHMMVEDPLQYLKPWAAAGFQRFIGHIEKMPDPVEFVAQGQLLGAVGLAIDGPTKLDDLQDLNLNDLDCLLVMTITAGKSGQEFQSELLEKVREIRKNYEYLPIEVDGGINDKSIVEAVEAGANRFVSTSHLFGSSSIREEYHHLTSLIHNS